MLFKTKVPRITAACALMALASCNSSAPSRPPPGHAAQSEIADELHDHGTRGFLFLAPMVPQPPASSLGVFVDTVPTTVRIDEITSAGITVRTLATFTSRTGPENEPIRVHQQGSPTVDPDGDVDPEAYYYTRWETNDAHLSTTALYRVRVLVPVKGGGTRELGFADLQVARTGRQFRSVDLTEFTPLLNGSVLRIKFRIEAPAVDQDGDGVFDWLDNCPTVANPTQLDTLHNGIGDACRCLPVTCHASDTCHFLGVCQPTTGVCTNPNATDGTACVRANASATCQAGACTLGACATGYGNCDGNGANGCETATTTTTTCGACGTVCAGGANATAVCTASTCGLTCAAGFANCDGLASNGCEQPTTADVANCGGCGVHCTADQLCTAGACTAVSCTTGTADCNHLASDLCEVNLTTDVANCGACANACSFAHAGASCVASACTLGACAGGYANCDGNAANGCETAPATDVNDCGACGHVCALANATPVCAAGGCAVAACNPGFADCDGNPVNGCEVTLGTDAANCGTCGLACSFANAGAVCASGACGLGTCNTGFANCDGNAGNGCETTPASNVANCGTCGHACPSGANSAPTCGSGACGIACATGFVDCDHNPTNGCEINATSDVANCGGCGIACTADQLCTAGSCTAVTCSAGTADCNHLASDLCEVNTQTDVGNCGACGTACAFPNAAAQCTAGACGFSVCNPGYADCDGIQANGCEVNLTTDVSHCGGCGTVCAFTNAGAVCAASACALGTCNAGFASCDGVAANGCETSLTTDINNCGACGTSCPFGPSSTPTCGTGTCGITCAAGYTDCDHNPANGCEIHTAADLANCGGCGIACTADQLCTAGACTAVTCSAGTADCNQLASDLCEVNTQTDVRNCGACNTACHFNNAGAACAGGTCAMGACAAGYADCNSNPVDGCEVNLNSSPSNCGGCGTVCTTPNGTPVCAAGACAVGSCSSGHADCNHLPGDGCEINLTTDPTNCLGCGVTCPSPTSATATCSSTGCGFACAAGYADCDGNPTNGCEVHTAGDVNNCGGCGASFACSLDQLCVSASCTAVTCGAGSADCNHLASDLCEVNTTNDVGNCGACGTTCAYANASGACAASTCALASCNPGYADCNASSVDGCEVNTSSSIANCGGCGRACTIANGAPACAAAVCTVAACNPGFSDCNHAAADGCEINLANNVNNCGACGNVCTVPNGTPTCAAGVCGVGACNAGYAFNGTVCVAIPPGLYWPMDDATGTTVRDQTANHDDGTFSAPQDPQWQAATNCRSGSCLYFNGTYGNGDKVDVSYGSSLRFGTADFTVSAWVRVASGTTDAHQNVVVGTNRGGVNQGWFLSIWAGRPNFATYGAGSANALLGPARLDDNTWHQIMGQRRGATVQILVDGVVVNTAAVSAGYNSDATGTVLEVGNQPQGTNGPPAGAEFRGYIDDVRIYGTTDPFGPLSCPSGQTACGVTCANTQTDTANCGTCGHACASGQTCTAGACLAPSSTYTAGGSPRNVAVDATGNAWVTNSGSNTVTRLAPNGSVLTTITGFSFPFGIGIESDGSAWVANFNSNSATHVSASGSVLRTVPTGSSPAELAIDGAGNVWIGNYHGGSITRLSSTGNLIGTSFGVNYPQFIAFDASGNAWVAQQFSTNVVEFSPSGAFLRSVNTNDPEPIGIAFDPTGNLWVTNGAGTTVTELNPATGAILGVFSSGGNAPYALTFDQHGNAWVANLNTSNVSELCGTTACGTIGAILATYPVGPNPSDVTIDTAGNVWTANDGSNTVTELIGAAH